MAPCFNAVENEEILKMTSAKQLLDKISIYVSLASVIVNRFGWGWSYAQNWPLS